MTAAITSLAPGISMPKDDFERVRSLVEGFPRATVTVFGDFCLDAYWDLSTEATEFSIETGQPVSRVRAQRYSLGGAGNIVSNLAAMGVGRIRAVGVVGIDLFGNQLRSLLAALGVAMDGIVASDDWQTMVYAKPFIADEEQSRIDFGAFNKLSDGTREALLRNVRDAVQGSDVVIFNQQVAGGVSSPEVISALNELINQNPSTLFLVDARHHAESYRGVMLKLNMTEAARLLGASGEGLTTDDCAREFALDLHRRFQQPVFVTRGELGMAVAAEGMVELIPGLQVIERTDPVGAGDTVIAALAASLAVGASPAHSAVLANLAATITVKKLRTTGTASATEIIEAAREPNYVFRPELAESVRHASYLPGSEIELVGDLPRDLDIRHCIFDHDGTLSTLREGWEKIMEPMMVRAILGDAYQAVDQHIFDSVTAMVQQFIDRTTGIQTLVQMQGLVRLVREAGFVPENQILDEYGYKQVYNTELLAMVRRRVEKLRCGELDSTDFQLKNAMCLLEELYRRGIKLYLASGTDVEDVIAEAEAMGYAQLFEGRIFGAVGDPNVEAKKLVVQRIMRENQLCGHHFATFGDGPVEMRETQRRGGFCIGVASDELRRFGLNTTKRKRLIRAGANLIIPDYSQLPLLLDTLRMAGASSAVSA